MKNKSFRPYVYLGNLFNDKGLSDNMNNIINENRHLVFSEILPELNKILSTTIRRYVVEVFEKYPYRLLILE